MKKNNVKEGDWFVVPLRTSGFGVGVVARKGRRGILFGYFFGPRHEHTPVLCDTRSLRPEDALFCSRFGDLGLRQGDWPILGRLDKWKRVDWPMPPFSRIDEPTGLAWLDRYDDNDPSLFVEEQRCRMDEAHRYPPQGLLGYGAVELLLTENLMK